MNSIIGSEVIKTASNMAPIVTPLTSIISGTKPASMVEQAAASNAAVSAATSNTAATVANGEKLILGVSQKNVIIGAGVIAASAALFGGIAFYRYKKSIPQAGVVIKLNAVPAPGISVSSPQLGKLTHAQKKDAKEMLKAIGQINDMDKIVADLKQIADSDTKELLGQPIDRFPGTTIQFVNTGDRVAMGVALVNLACFNARGYKADVTYTATDNEAEIRVIPIVKGKPLENVEVIPAINM